MRWYCAGVQIWLENLRANSVGLFDSSQWMVLRIGSGDISAGKRRCHRNAPTGASKTLREKCPGRRCNACNTSKALTPTAMIALPCWVIASKVCA
ncbi:hypothetical protein D3C81_1849560 [compost metagenome]